MVDMDKVKERLMRGAFVGLGSFTSSFAGSFIEEYAPGGDLATGAGQVAIGLGVSVGVDEVLDSRNSLPNEAVEFAGYGIQGAGWANLGESIQTGAQTGRVVSVSEGGSNGSSNSNNSQASETQNNRAYSLDTA